MIKEYDNFIINVNEIHKGLIYNFEPTSPTIYQYSHLNNLFIEQCSKYSKFDEQ